MASLGKLICIPFTTGTSKSACGCLGGAGLGDSRRTGEEGAVLAPDACRLVGELGWRGGEDGSVGDDVVRAVLGRVDEEALGNGGRMSDRRRRNDGPACDDDSAWKSTTDSYEGGDAFIAAWTRRRQVISELSVIVSS